MSWVTVDSGSVPQEIGRPSECDLPRNRPMEPSSGRRSLRPRFLHPFPEGEDELPHVVSQDDQEPLRAGSPEAPEEDAGEALLLQVDLLGVIAVECLVHEAAITRQEPNPLRPGQDYSHSLLGHKGHAVR